MWMRCGTVVALVSLAMGTAALPASAVTRSEVVAQIDSGCHSASRLTENHPTKILARTDPGAAQNPWHAISAAEYASISQSSTARLDIARIWLHEDRIAWVQVLSQEPPGKSVASYCYRTDGALAMIVQHAYDAATGFRIRQTIYFDQNGAILERRIAEKDGDPALWTNVHSLPFYGSI